MSVVAFTLNRPELRFTDLLVPWILIIGLLGFKTAWLIAAIMERTGLSRFVANFPLFFLALVILLGAVIGLMFLP